MICDEGDLNSEEPDAPCRTTCVLPSCGDGVMDTGEASVPDASAGDGSVGDGAVGDASDDGGTDPDTSGGCGRRVVGSSRGAGPFGWLMAALIVGWRWRRRPR